MSDRQSEDPHTGQQPSTPGDSAAAQSVEWVLNTDQLVRQQALGEATSVIEYRSAGHCLVVGALEQCVLAAARLGDLPTTWLITDESNDTPVSTSMMSQKVTEDGVVVIESGVASGAMVLTGHMGAFDVSVSLGNLNVTAAAAAGGAVASFDLVLDLTPAGIQSAPLPPFGYLHVTEPAPEAALFDDFVALVGEFEKPRYFGYNASQCAHSRSQLEGCHRCIDVCSAAAITDDGEGVRVDPYLCQGCGTCATVCPSGAMTYAWPRVPQAIDTTRSLRTANHPAASVLLLYRQQEDADADARFEETLPAHVMPVALEEVTAFGIDYWATMIAAGLSSVVILSDGTHDQGALTPLKNQAALLNTILKPLGFLDDRVLLCTEASLADTLNQAASVPHRETAGPAFATHDQKRQTFRMAVDQLVEQHGSNATAVPDAIPLPAGSPFGTLTLDKNACTLCMACVSVCPMGALLDGQDAPKVRFIEADCVQCGLCEIACPENAIERSARYRYDSLAARQIETLHEDSPFHCVRCHKAFATSSMIQMMTDKLAGHWMFTDDKAMRRLKMCEDCRVVDMFEEDADGITVHRDTPS